MIFKRWLVLCVCFMFTGIVPGVVHALTIPTPTVLPGGKIITALDAKTLLDSKGAVFYDARRSIRYAEGHLSGATNLPYVQNSAETATFDATVDQFSLSSLPTNKAAAIVFYSNSSNGWKSFKAAVQAIRQGYTDVRWLRNGLAGWTAAGFSVVK